MGTPAGKNVVSQWLREQGYRRRQPQKKRTMKPHADRNAPFKKMVQLKQQYLEAGQPVIRMDTNKKEWLGNCYREGVTDAVEPTIVNDPDFSSFGNGYVIPHGIYEVGRNEAALHLNTSHDTTELAGESIELWWREPGQVNYPNTDEVLILGDGGGSNSSSKYLFKEDLPALSTRWGLKIRMAHYPPSGSKYNPIEPRRFPHVTRACHGVPLENVETAKYYMEKTQTTQGLSVIVRIIDKVFETGRQYAKDFQENMTIPFDELFPKWNDTAIPLLE
jgi:hypothetical protein